MEASPVDASIFTAHDERNLAHKLYEIYIGVFVRNLSKKIIQLGFGALAFAGIAITANAAIAPLVQKVQAPMHKNILRGQGALQGGKAGAGFSILDLKSMPIAKKSERVMIDIGDARSEKLQGSIGYYTVEMKKNNKLVLTFAKTLNSKIENKDLQKRFFNSRYVAGSQFQFDPIGQNMTLELQLKKAVVARVVSLKGDKETGKLVLDMVEDQAPQTKQAQQAKQVKLIK